MAIKPVTNKDTLNKSEVNRADQTSFRTEKGNAKVVIRKFLLSTVMRKGGNQLGQGLL